MTRRDALHLGGWFFLLNSIFVLLIALRYARHPSPLEGFWTWLYIGPATLSHFISLTFLPYILLFVPVALLIPRRSVLAVWGAVIVAVGLGVIGIDTFVYDFYRFHINSFALELVFGGAGTDIFYFHYTQYLLVASVVGVLLFIEIYAFRKLDTLRRASRLIGGRCILVTVAVMLFFSYSMYGWADMTGYRQIVRITDSFPLYFPTTANMLLHKYGIKSIGQDCIDLIRTDSDTPRELNYPIAPIMTDTILDSKMNVLIVLLDSWSTRVFDETTMPHLTSFANEGIRFNKHYSGSNGTRSGVFSIFYSIPGIYWYDMLASGKSPVLIDHLKANNYKTGIFTSASLTSPPFDKTVFAEIENLRLRTEGPSSFHRDKVITEDWLGFTEQLSDSDSSKPFFGFLFYDALHPNTVPKDYDGPFQPSVRYTPYGNLSDDMDVEPMWNLYRNIAWYEDSLVNVVLEDLREKNLLDNTIVIITGDHGQEFNENKKGYWGHNGNYSAIQIGVPFMMKWPGMEPQVYDHWTSHYDIVPTLMQNMFGSINPVTDYSVGKNLFDFSDRKWLLVNSHDHCGIIEEDRITIIHSDCAYDITDLNLDYISDAKLDTVLMNEVIGQVNRYYYK